MVRQIVTRNIRGASLLLLLVLALGGLSRIAEAGKYNSTRSINDPAPAWEKLPAADGKQYAFKDFDKYDVLVVVFTCNSCPYANDYEGRINQLAKAHAGEASRVALVAINVNKVKEDLLPAMTERAQKQGLVFPYLFDETQKIAKEFGAAWTPECFVLNKERKIVYMGAFDDNTKAADVQKHYVADAIAATLRHEAVATPETPAVGCAVRYVRERKR